MRSYPAADPAAPRLLLAHGAGTGESHPWMQRVAAGLAERGISVTTFDFPYMAAGRKAPDRGPILEDAFAAQYRNWRTAGPAARAWFVGGKSMGGRMASQVMARQGFIPEPDGLVCFGYPLHPPGRPDARRDGHLAAIGRPALLLHGTRDPFGSPDEIRAATELFPAGTLHLVEAGDHSLSGPRSVDRNGELLEQALDVSASWMLARAVPL